MNARARMSRTIGAWVTFLFGVLSLWLGIKYGRPLPNWSRAALGAGGLALSAWIGLSAKACLDLLSTAPAWTEQHHASSSPVWRRFVLINGIQLVVIAVAGVALWRVKRPDDIAAAVAIIVGLHFLALAGLFRTPTYYATGPAGCCIGVAALWIPDLALRAIFLGLSFGLLLWVTTAIVLAQRSQPPVIVEGPWP